MFLVEDKLFAIKFFTVSAVGPSRKGKAPSRFSACRGVGQAAFIPALVIKGQLISQGLGRGGGCCYSCSYSRKGSYLSFFSALHSGMFIPCKLEARAVSLFQVGGKEHFRMSFEVYRISDFYNFPSLRGKFVPLEMYRVWT